jgi:hypothetical protein
MKINKKIKYLVFLLPMFMFACSPDNDDYADNWTGTWKTNEDVVISEGKSTHIGDITKDETASNKVIISGTLFGMNSSYSLPAEVGSSTATFNKTTTFTINGKATLYDSDSITFKFSITKNNITKSYVIGATKQSK